MADAAIQLPRAYHQNGYALACEGQDRYHDDPKQNCIGASRLHIACLRGDRSAAEECLRCGSRDLEDDGQHGLGTPLHCAVAAGHLDLTRHLLTKVPDVKAFVNKRIASFGNQSMLQLAVLSETDAERKRAMIEMLVTAGARLHTQDRTGAGFTPFHQAVHEGDFDLVRWLWNRYGEDVLKKRDAEREDHLMQLLHSAREPRLLRFLVRELHAPINRKHHHQTLVMKLVRQIQGGGEGTGENRSIELLREALGLGADPSLTDSLGNTPLQRACEFGLEQTAALLSAGPVELRSLVEMGFSTEDSQAALACAGGDLAGAVMFLTALPEYVQQLTSMGFPEDRARKALLRFGGVNAAAQELAGMDA